VLPQHVDPPSPFYRVAAKALVFNDVGKLLMVQNAKQNWGLPGGGWEHNEDFADCLRREFLEEVGVEVASIGPILFTYRAMSSRGYAELRLVAHCTLRSDRFVPDDDTIAAKFVSKSDFLQLRLALNDQPFDQTVNDLANRIWSIYTKGSGHGL